eukprot:CAMPEP_0174249746 /NCGR_PEP_ID=MMETSP0439-20130205/93_1 /TAXON_ID=0 /ORGANISM="Stereomyxa ramosa, Strain Chinc5" /LENGTH=403 /DNA_ID=CAMNT_0015329645 /DNA_START=33 /DNA_END=1244 /DNA_ORIENTATION=+
MTEQLLRAKLGDSLPAERPKEGPLAGVKILDFTQILSGPMATMILGDQGAEVVKVEDSAGDSLRYLYNQRAGLNNLFAFANRNKKSIVLDLKSQEDILLIKKMVMDVDVVAQNYRPGVVERLGLSYEDLKKINPDIIYLSITGFGTKGPAAESRVYDSLIQAAVGIADMQGTKSENGELTEPRFINTLVCDKITAVFSAQAITAALYARRVRGGGGQHIDLSMLDASLFFFWGDNMSSQAFVGDGVLPLPNVPPSAPYATKNGFVGVLLVKDAEWIALCKTVRAEYLINHEDYNSIIGRVVNYRKLKELMAEIIKQSTTEELVERAQKYDAPLYRVNTIAEVVDDQQVVANGSLLMVDHPVGGPMRTVRPAALFSSTPQSIRSHSPAVGQHTREIKEKYAAKL